MFQFTMAPYSPPDAITTDSIQHVIEDQLSYLSPQCRDIMFECLGMYFMHVDLIIGQSLRACLPPVARLSVDELLKRRWLRNIDFLSVPSKRDGALYSNAQTRQMLYNSLIWKLATFFVANRCTYRPNGQPEDEDADNRQRSRVRSTLGCPARTLPNQMNFLFTYAASAEAILCGSTIVCSYRISDSVAPQCSDATFRNFTHAFTTSYRCN